MYWARHSFANIARNKCGISKDDIGEALNHVNEDHKTTDIYLDRDLSIVDMVQEQVRRALQGKFGFDKPTASKYLEDDIYSEDLYFVHDPDVLDGSQNDKLIRSEILIDFLLGIGY